MEYQKGGRLISASRVPCTVLGRHTDHLLLLQQCLEARSIVTPIFQMRTLRLSEVKSVAQIQEARKSVQVLEFHVFPGNTGSLAAHCLSWVLQVDSTYYFFFFLSLFIYLFLAVLGLRFCARAFSSCGKRGPLFIAVRRPLTIAASLVAEHRLQTRRLSNCGSRAQLLRGMWDLPRPGLEPVSPALAGRFPTTAPPGKPSTYYFEVESSEVHFSHIWAKY